MFLPFLTETVTHDSPDTDSSAALEPLFEAQLCLQAPEIVFRPSLEFHASDGFPHLVESLISDVFRIPRLCHDYLSTSVSHTIRY